MAERITHWTVLDGAEVIQLPVAGWIMHPWVNACSGERTEYDQGKVEQADANCLDCLAQDPGRGRALYEEYMAADPSPPPELFSQAELAAALSSPRKRQPVAIQLGMMEERDG